MDKPEATTEVDRLRRQLETVSGGSAIKSERIYEMAEKIADLTARLAEAERERDDYKERHGVAHDNWRQFRAKLAESERERDIAIVACEAVATERDELRAEVARLKEDRLNGQNDYCALREIADAEIVARETAEARLVALRGAIGLMLERIGRIEHKTHYHQPERCAHCAADELEAALADSAE